MKKIILLFFCILNLCTASAQKSTNFIYVDFSSTKKLSKLSEKVKTVAKDFNEPFVLFISNDNAPIIIKENASVENGLNQIFSLRPSSPDFINEIDTINATFSNLNLNLGLHQQGSSSNDKAIFYFFLNTEKFEQNFQNKNLIDRLLLTNQLISKVGVIKDVEVIIFLDSDFDELSYFYSELITNKKFKVQSY